MWDGFNKRKFPRMNVDCEIVVHPEMEPPILAVTENLGVGGVCILLAKPLDRFSTCHLRLDLKNHLPKINCKGKVVWIIPTKKGAKETKHSYDVGIEFVDLSDESSSLLRQFLEEQPADMKTQK